MVTITIYDVSLIPTTMLFIAELPGLTDALPRPVHWLYISSTLFYAGPMCGQHESTWCASSESTRKMRRVQPLKEFAGGGGGRGKVKYTSIRGNIKVVHKVKNN
jgi:hypothetical protein